MYTFKQLVIVLSNRNESYVSVISVKRSSFYDWDKFFSEKLSYKKAVKDVSKFHCFYYDDQYKEVLKKERNRLSDRLIEQKLHLNYG